jgi:hypothetical protein
MVTEPPGEVAGLALVLVALGEADALGGSAATMVDRPTGAARVPQAVTASTTPTPAARAHVRMRVNLAVADLVRRVFRVARNMVRAMPPAGGHGPVELS